MQKPDQEDRYLTDWDTELTDEWIDYAKTMQTSHCRNSNANEKGDQYTEDLFHKIDILVLMHAFGSSMKNGAPHSSLKMNFNSTQRQQAEKIRKMILKYGKTKGTDGKSSVCVQIISVVMMLVDCPDDRKEKKEENHEKEKKPPGLAQIPVFRVVKSDGNYCFIDQTSRYYEDWNDYLANNKLPQCKMCYPRNGEYRFIEDTSSTNDENNKEEKYILDLQLSESTSCTTWECIKSIGLKVVSCVSLVAGVVCIVAVPFTGGASVGVYATYAAATAGWVSFGCMMIGAVSNLGSLWDKYWHDESCVAEIVSLALVVLHYGVAKYNAEMIDKLKYEVPVTPTELILMTVLNCTRFAVDSIMFVMTLVHLVKKACNEGISSITPMELIQFSMSAYFFGKTVFEPKTGYGIIKEAQQRYVMVEKRATIKNEGALEKYDDFVDAENRFGDGSKTQTMKDDWKGITCSQDVCDELNRNGDLIRNINSFEDLNQFFLEVSDTNSVVSMTEDGKMMVNDLFETDGSKLNAFGETKDGINEQRRKLLGGTATMRQADIDASSTFDNRDQMHDGPYETKMKSLGEQYKQGEDMVKEVIKPCKSTPDQGLAESNQCVVEPSSNVTEQDPKDIKLEQILAESHEAAMESGPTVIDSVQSMMAPTTNVMESMSSIMESTSSATNWIPATSVPVNTYITTLRQQGVKCVIPTILSQAGETYFATINDIPIIGDQKDFVDALISLLNNDISTFNRILETVGFDSPFQGQTTVDDIADFIEHNNIARGFDRTEIKNLLSTPGKRGKKAIRLKVESMLAQIKNKSSSPNKSKKRGDHIINNGVLKVYQDIINNFTSAQFRKEFKQLDFIPTRSPIHNDYDNTFPEDVKHNIGQKLVVHLNGSYFDANSLLYGTAIFMLNELAKNYMNRLYENINRPPETWRIKFVIKAMNEYEIYVDQVALQAWNTNDGNMRIYYKALSEVKAMFYNLCNSICMKLYTWTSEIRRHDPAYQN